MSDLASVQDLQSHLGIEDDSAGDVLQELLDDVEELLEIECNRRERPFRAKQDALVEVHDGTGSALLALDYPIADVTTITLGRSAADPDETLDADDVDVVVWTVGRRLIRRVDGGTWGDRGSPRYVRVTYDAQADLPGLAKLAVLRAAAALYLSRGSEDVKMERTATYTRELAAPVDDPLWKRAVAAYRELRV